MYRQLFYHIIIQVNNIDTTIDNEYINISDTCSFINNGAYKCIMSNCNGSTYVNVNMPTSRNQAVNRHVTLLCVVAVSQPNHTAVLLPKPK